MDGKQKLLLEELFTYAQEIMDRYKMYPYVAFVVKNEKIIARGFNQAKVEKYLYGGDITLQGDVVAIRNAQEALQSGNLSGCILYSFMEPTILGFDVALWAGIKDFVWCVNSSSLKNHYNNLKYTPLDYQQKNPEKISIKNGIWEQEALKLVGIAQKNKYYPEQ